MAKIKWTAEAESWLTEIFEYIAQENPVAAKNVAQSIYEQVQILRDYPEIGYKYRTEKEGDIRILLYGHYRIAYLIRTPGQIDILGVFHGAMDFDRYLQ